MSAKAVKPVLIQGNHHSFHAQAAVKLGLTLDACLPIDTHTELYEALEGPVHETAVVAVVNSSIGRIRGSYEHILSGRQTITGRVDLPISFNIYAKPGARLEDIEVVHTQSHAYNQCQKTLRQRIPEARWQEEQDTAGSAFIVRDQDNLAHAAICPKSAGEAAGLVCLLSNIQDSEDNHTTFYQISSSKQAAVPETANIAVAIFTGAAPGQYLAAEQQLTSETGIVMRPLHHSEATAQHLIVELPATDHAETISRAQDVLTEFGALQYVGGYATSTENFLDQDKL